MKVLLQILILAIFVISSGYQSIVTSFMLEPVRVPLLKTLNGLFDSDLNLEHSWSFEYFQESNPKYQKAKGEGRILINKLKTKFSKAAELKYAFQVQCEKYKKFIERTGDGKIMNMYHGLYLIPEPFDSMAVDLYTKPFHPYLDQFQQIMDRTFEAGLPVIWNEWYYLNIFGYSGAQTIRLNGERVKKYSLDFDLIAPFFLILVVGFIAAFIALSFEIFYHDFVSELTKKYFRRKFKEIFSRELRIKRKTHVRQIQVKPV